MRILKSIASFLAFALSQVVVLLAMAAYSLYRGLRWLGYSLFIESMRISGLPEAEIQLLYKVKVGEVGI